MYLVIPASLLPADGRFGSGPSKVRQPQVAAVMDAWAGPMGTSHRQAEVRAVVGRIRAGLAELFALPPGYEVVLGNGGATAFWAIATACLVTRRAQACVFGEFGGKFAAELARAPFLAPPVVISAPPGSVSFFTGPGGGSAGDDAVGRVSSRSDDAETPALAALDFDGEVVDAYATVQNETSTGAAVPISRFRPDDADALMLVDATSAAGALPIDISDTDVYYFSPQKAFASDGGLWVAIASPAAIERAARIESDLPSVAGSGFGAGGAGTSSGAGGARWIPEFLSFTTALENSRLDQTLNTPAIATLIMFAEQVEWLLGNGGLPWAIARSAASAAILYNWAESKDWASPFVADPAYRSNVVGTIDLADTIDAAALVSELRANGIYDVFPYRKLGRNQLRVAMFPAIEPDDVAALTGAIDYLVTHSPA